MALKEMGVTRIVLSREAPLTYSKFLSAKTDMELEYFIHGDMCVAHGGQCLYSGILFGQSSNRGRCLKPCRWGYEIMQGEKRYPLDFPKEQLKDFPLAVKTILMRRRSLSSGILRINCFCSSESISLDSEVLSIPNCGAISEANAPS